MLDILGRAVRASAFIGLGTLIMSLFPVAAGAQSDPPCPLTRDQALEAARAFERMLPVLQHPRCLNCHGGFGDLHENPRTRHPAPGGGYIPQDSFGKSEDACTSCHDRAHRPPGVEREWEIPRPSMFFTNPPIQVCRRFKTTENGTGAGFIRHIQFDYLIKLGFEGKKGQNDKPPEPPPMLHTDFVKLGKAWVAAVYGTSDERSWKQDFPGADSPCGCDPNVFKAEPPALSGPAPDVWVRTGPFLLSDGKPEPPEAVPNVGKLDIAGTRITLKSYRTGLSNWLEWSEPPTELTVGGPDPKKQEVILKLTASDSQEGPLVGGWWNINCEADKSGKGDKAAGSKVGYRLTGDKNPHKAEYTFKFQPGTTGDTFIQFSGGNDFSPKLWVLVTYKYVRTHPIRPPP